MARAHWATLVVTLLLIQGCASMRAADTERRLSASGFQMKLATTPEQMAHLEGLKQHKIFATQKDGSVVYAYADASDCKCLMVGSEKDYQAYQRLMIQQQEINQQQMAAEEVDDASMNWGMWGPWARPIVY